MKKLPKKFQGAAVVRGLGMKSDKFDKLVEDKALDQFDALRDTYLVIEDKALEEDSGSVVVRCFIDEADALCYAKACANGNVDHRVLRVTQQTLVVATQNNL